MGTIRETVRRSEVRDTVVTKEGTAIVPVLN